MFSWLVLIENLVCTIWRQALKQLWLPSIYIQIQTTQNTCIFLYEYIIFLEKKK